jgi:RNA polymerase sigma-70 factor (ECF subfamily)
MSRPYDASKPEVDALLVEAPSIRRWLEYHRVPEIDRDDLVSETISIAWWSIQLGNYKPDPSMTERAALKAWIRGMTWRHVATYRGRAHRRYEQMMDPAELPARAVQDPLAVIIAYDELKILAEVKPARRKVLVAVAQGHGMTEIADAMGIPLATAYSRLRHARLDLAAALRRRAAGERL